MGRSVCFATCLPASFLLPCTLFWASEHHRGNVTSVAWTNNTNHSLWDEGFYPEQQTWLIVYNITFTGSLYYISIDYSTVWLGSGWNGHVITWIDARQVWVHERRPQSCCGPRSHNLHQMSKLQMQLSFCQSVDTHSGSVQGHCTPWCSAKSSMLPYVGGSET